VAGVMYAGAVFRPSEVAMDFARLLVPAVLNCPHIGAERKCTSHAPTHWREKATRISASTIVLRATMRCTLLFGVPPQ
jgi:hypothetical protein